ncbi:MAG: COP23 domain-containing protein [Pleurocapsa sp. MO_226.B13]|nr:COP23 domain-containing protein [Pleurocapsa sp. MO_226.B13]
MNTKYFGTLLLATTIVGLVSPEISSNTETIVNQPERSDRVSFYCGEIVDRETDENIPATIAYVPQRKANIAIIAWKSNYIPEWDAQRRCDTVSPKFQTFYEDGRLNYLTTGINNGEDIICATIETGQPCQGRDQLFQVKRHNDPQAVLEGLIGIIEGTSSEPLYQSSSQQIYVSIEELLNIAPAIDKENLTSN